MNIEEIRLSLPNGFHDSILRSIAIDYVNRVLVICLDVDMTEDGCQVRTFQQYELRVIDFDWVVIEPPDCDYPYDQQGPEVDGGLVEDIKNSSVMHLISKSGHKSLFYYWFYVQQWNSFIYIAAKDVELLIGV